MKYILEYSKYKSYKVELQDIKDAAISDGTFMKTPNGTVSNLSEKQWLQVRTKNFINWFGDWLNDPKQSSIMIDENGEPKLFYHGTRSSDRIEVFNFYRTEIGFWFTGNKKIARNLFGETNKVYTVFLNIRNPKNIESTESFTDNNENDAWLKLWDMTDGFLTKKETELRLKLSKEGFDSIILKNSKKDILEDDWKTAKGEDQIIVFRPNQIKSATTNNGDFNINNENIYK